MKTTNMKNYITRGFGLIQLLTLIAIVAVLSAITGTARAQQYEFQTLGLSTNVIAASSTLTATNVITTTKRNNVGYVVSFNLSGTGVGNVITSWAKGINGTFETTPSVTMTNAANGTNTVVGFGNTTMGAGGQLKLVSIQNANTPSTVANLVIKAATKPGN